MRTDRTPTVKEDRLGYEGHFLDFFIKKEVKVTFDHTLQWLTLLFSHLLRWTRSLLVLLELQSGAQFAKCGVHTSPCSSLSR